MRVQQRSSWRRHQFLHEVQEEPSHEPALLTKDLTFRISEDNNLTRTVLHIITGNITSEQFRKIIQSRFSTRSVFWIWGRIAPLSFLFEEYHLGRSHLYNFLINEELLILINIFAYFIHSTFLKDTRHLQFDRAGRNVEFALHPQHETSCHPEIQTKEETL